MIWKNNTDIYGGRILEIHFPQELKYKKIMILLHFLDEEIITQSYGSVTSQRGVSIYRVVSSLNIYVIHRHHFNF